MFSHVELSVNGPNVLISICFSKSSVFFFFSLTHFPHQFQSDLGVFVINWRHMTTGTDQARQGGIALMGDLVN